jgi:hypothetical protein
MSAHTTVAKRARPAFDLACSWYRHPVLRRHLWYGAVAALVSILLIASCVVGVLVWHMH